jgi:uncharacterized protein YcbX
VIPAPLSVAQIWRYPVKSMGGEQLTETDVGFGGIPWDRGWAVRDEKAQAIRSARYIPRLLLCSARYLAGTDAGLVPHVEITLPDQSTVNSDDPKVHDRLSDALGRKVTLWSLKPPEEIEHLKLGPQALETGDKEAERRMLLGLQPGDPLPDLSAIPAPLLRQILELATPPGTYFDAFPITILTMSSVRHLQQFVPDVVLDARRFRPNFLLEDGRDSNAIFERDWIGRRVLLGRAAAFDVVMEAPRCTIIAAEQAGGIKKDARITRAIVENMRQNIAVYASVASEGRVRLGDTLEVVHPAVS